MKNFFNIFFVVLGVIFLILIFIAILFLAFDPLGMRSSGGNFSMPSMTSGNSTSETTTDKHPLLSAEQERALESFGIDPATIPTSITPEQEACFEQALGSERVAEIKGGASPSAADYFKARACI